MIHQLLFFPFHFFFFSFLIFIWPLTATGIGSLKWEEIAPTAFISWLRWQGVPTAESHATVTPSSDQPIVRSFFSSFFFVCFWFFFLFSFLSSRQLRRKKEKKKSQVHTERGRDYNFLPSLCCISPSGPFSLPPRVRELYPEALLFLIMFFKTLRPHFDP